MRNIRASSLGSVTVGVAVLLLAGADASRVSEERLWRYRNLGKAFYENPATQNEAVEEFRKALGLAPDSPRDRLNYGLALLRAGKTKEGIAEIEKAQQQDPKIPHTWFNLGIAFKKDGQYERAEKQFEQMIQLVPDEPVSHYNLAVLYKLAGKKDPALEHFEIASRLNPNLAGPHFQLYNAYRQAARSAEAARELKIFQEIKKRQEGAAVPEDMEWSYYSEIFETIKDRTEPVPAVELSFQDRKLADGFDAGTAGLLPLDADGNGAPDLFVWSARGAQLFKNGITPNARFKDAVGVAPGDFNNDGLVDLAVVTPSGAALYRNQKGAFVRQQSSLPSGTFAKAVWLDYDHDYDLDLFLLGEKSVLLRNQGPAGFVDHTAAFPFVSGTAIDGVVLDLVPDTDGMDLVVAYRDQPGVIYRDKLAAKYEAVPSEALPAKARSLAAFDVNNDSWTDLLAGGVILLNRKGKLERASGYDAALTFGDFANRGFSDLVGSSRIFKTAIPEAVAAAAADFDQDGRTDLALIATSGALHLLKNNTATRGNWAKVQVTGVKNLKLAQGAEIEVKSGTAYQKRFYDGLPLLFGLGPTKEIDTIRITWPNGLIQNEPKQLSNRPLAFKEAQRLSGSCPMIFTWNGKKFEFITDVLGVAPLGASAGEGRYFPVDHDEYVQIPAESLAPVDGQYEIRITEELREVSYLDHIRLLAVEHPENIEIFTNDKFKGPPFPKFRLFGVQQRIYPRAARDHSGRDVRERLLRRDQSYPDRFERDYSGVAELHHVDLDFGNAAADNRAVLILNGWVDWADGSTFLAAEQTGKGLVLPYLQVKDAHGRWQTVIHDMGIPAGKPKTIAVDMTGKFLSPSREVRIVTNLCVYWDEVFLSEDTSSPAFRTVNLAAGSADLRFRGFSKPVLHPQRKQPESFDYGQWMPVSMWNPTPGYYTRYGDVMALLSDIDDRLVVMGSGDELRLRFPAYRARAGFTLSFLLFVDGWAKDGDANTSYSKTVAPLPFHGMKQYGEHRPDQEGYNTRPARQLLRPLLETP